MSTLRALKILFALAFGMALPTISALGYFVLTGDPTFRPLGISEAALARFANSQEDLAVVVTIRRGRDTGLNATTSEVERKFAAALRPYDVPMRIRTEIVPGRDVTVTLQVRSTHLGPFDLRSAPSAISAAVSAYHLNFETEQASDTGWTFLN